MVVLEDERGLDIDGWIKVILVSYLIYFKFSWGGSFCGVNLLILWGLFFIVV